MNSLIKLVINYQNTKDDIFFEKILEKLKNLILCAWRFALAAFQVGDSFISDFFAPFCKKKFLSKG